MRIISVLLISLKMLTLSAQADAARRYPGTAVQDLRSLADKGDRDAIFRLGELRDTASLPLLLKLAQPVFVPQPPPNNREAATFMATVGRREKERVSLEARRAIARMNVHPDISDYARCIDDPGVFNRNPCIEALGYIADVKAVKHLAPLLWDKGSPPNSGHELGYSYAYSAALALGKIFPDMPPKTKRLRGDALVKYWQEWCGENANKY